MSLSEPSDHKRCTRCGEMFKGYWWERACDRCVARIYKPDQHASRSYTSMQLAWNRFSGGKYRETGHDQGLRIGYATALDDITSGRIDTGLVRGRARDTKACEAVPERSEGPNDSERRSSPVAVPSDAPKSNVPSTEQDPTAR